MNSTILVALILIGAIVAIVSILVLISRKQARQKAAVMRNAYQNLLQQHNLTPTQEEEFRHRILGLDSAKRVLVAIQPASEKPYEIVSLADVTDCRIHKEGLSLKNKRANGQSWTEDHVNSISLSLLQRNGHAIDVPVYSEILDGQEEKILLHQKAVKWQERINTVLRKN
jgi:type II secretory pathway pseudopilin PulG